MVVMKDKHAQGTIVQIFGEDYRIFGEGDIAEIQRVARHVDKKMREVAEQSGQISSTSLAVLAAMETTAELFQARQEKEQLIQKACTSIDRLKELVDQRSTLVPLTSKWLERRFGNIGNKIVPLFGNKKVPL